MRKPALEVVNRFGAAFGQNRNPNTYNASGLRFRSYYRLVCLRCGWSFARDRWKAHDRERCDLTIAANSDPVGRAHRRANLYGVPEKSR